MSAVLSATQPAAAPDFAAVKTRQQAAFAREVMALIDSRSRSGDATLVLPSEYVEVVVVRS